MSFPSSFAGFRLQRESYVVASIGKLYNKIIKEACTNTTFVNTVAVHPGETLLETLETSNMTQTELAGRIR